MRYCKACPNRVTCGRLWGCKRDAGAQFGKVEYESEPPAFKGGQGRSAHEVSDSLRAITWSAFWVGVMLIALAVTQ